MDLNEYQKRLNSIFNTNIEILSYNGLSAPIKYKCPICGAEKSACNARDLLARFSLCDKCYGTEKSIIKRKIDDLFSKNDEYILLNWHGSDKKMKIKCNSCGEIYSNYPRNIIQHFDGCPFCREQSS